MKSLYPPIKKFKVLLAMLMITGSLHAQNSDYVSNSPKEVNVSHTTPIRYSDAVVRIIARNQKQVTLTWAPFGAGVSHYILERSGDGRNYEEAGVFFTGDWNEEPAYRFTDKLHRSYNGRLFYRLRVVGLDESEVYTFPSLSQPISF